MTGQALAAALGHNDYFRPGTESMRSLALIGLGRGDLVDGEGRTPSTPGPEAPSPRSGPTRRTCSSATDGRDGRHGHDADRRGRRFGGVGRGGPESTGDTPASSVGLERFRDQDGAARPARLTLVGTVAGDCSSPDGHLHDAGGRASALRSVQGSRSRAPSGRACRRRLPRRPGGAKRRRGGHRGDGLRPARVRRRRRVRVLPGCRLRRRGQPGHGPVGALGPAGAGVRRPRAGLGARHHAGRHQRRHRERHGRRGHRPRGRRRRRLPGSLVVGGVLFLARSSGS